MEPHAQMPTPEDGRHAGHVRSRRRLSYANVASTLALVFALGGGSAWAATHVHYLVTSTKQIKPSVLKSLHGAKGATGSTGRSGVKGVEGVSGVNGVNGAPGLTGVQGAAGASGAVAGYTATASGIPFTGGTNTPIVSQTLPAGSYIVSATATITAQAANVSTSFEVTCKLSDIGGAASEVSPFTGITSFPLAGIAGANVATLPFDLAMTSPVSTAAKLTCSDTANSGNGYTVTATNARITALQTTSNN